MCIGIGIGIGICFNWHSIGIEISADDNGSCNWLNVYKCGFETAEIFIPVTSYGKYQLKLEADFF